LWDQQEAAARGEIDAYYARQQQWRKQAQLVSREQRVHYYATELRSMQAYMQLDMRAYAQTIRAPTYVIHGTDDQMVPLADAIALAQALSKAQLDIIDAGPHSLLHRDAESRQRVLAFMRSVDALY
jgi:pimeloyl-ACP methyl ester carboxylesterase